ncbi:MAG: universal stress protein [Acidobacteriaceae bacterium]|nr:universal stress protein [Acidobacteriaceae bacterium]MBV8572061.1 universal stress protein [Acidobacteriaceae bacterium]
MIENILFPVDFSPSCVAIASFVSGAAEMFASRVTLLHVCDLDSHNGFELYVRCPQEIAEEHLNVARRRIDSFLESEFPPYRCARIVRSGDPAEQIAEVAASGRFDLIVMPTHAGPFRRMFLGSTTAKVLDTIDCPVLTTRHAETIEPRPLEHRHWLCAIALDNDAPRLLQFAKQAAVTAGAKLSLIHVVQGSGNCPEHGYAGQEAFRRIRELQKCLGCDALARVVGGAVKDAVLEAAQLFEADVLIIGRPRTESHGHMRDLTYSLVRDAPCPVLSV